jgi:hypothetical protein
MSLQPIERTLRRFLIDVARHRRVTTYTEMAEVLRPYSPTRLEPPYSPMHGWLGSVSSFEVKAGRPMLSAVVVRRDTERPGEGFFDLARRYLGFDFDDDDQFWLEQRESAYKVWADGAKVLVDTQKIALDDGRVIRIREYQGGAVRINMDDAPYAITETFLTKGRRSSAAQIRLEPLDWVEGIGLHASQTDEDG